MDLTADMDQSSPLDETPFPESTENSAPPPLRSSGWVATLQASFMRHLLPVDDPLDEVTDEHGLYSDGLIVPRPHADYMWKVAWWCVPAGLYAVYRKHYDLALVPFGVWLTSLTFWRQPVYGWRRNLDIAYVSCALGWQVFRSLGAEYQYTYYALVGSGIGCYAASWLVHAQSVWLSTILHAGLHILSNMSNVMLYHGHVPPLPEAFTDFLHLFD